MDREEFIARTLEIEYSLYRVAKTLLRDENDCQDAVQDALLKGFARLYSLKNPEYFKTWMTRILINVCNDILKKRRKNTWQELDETLPAQDDSRRREVYEALQLIPANERMPLILHYLEGMTVAEVSHVLKTPQGTVKRRLSKGKKMLVVLLEVETEVLCSE